jgi:hypothetical protein
MSGTEVWPEGTRREVVANHSVLAAGAAMGAWLLFDGWWRLVVALASAGFFLAWALVGDVPRLAVTPVDLERLGRRPQRLRLADITRVETEWMPYRDSVLRFVAPNGTIECRVNEKTRPFIRTVGGHLLGRRRQIHASRSAMDLLGWPARQGQMD